MDMLEIENPESAAERFCEILAECKADPIDIVLYIDKIMKRMKK